jgi:hypothetical protein
MRLRSFPTPLLLRFSATSPLLRAHADVAFFVFACCCCFFFFALHVSFLVISVNSHPPRVQSLSLSPRVRVCVCFIVLIFLFSPVVFHFVLLSCLLSLRLLHFPLGFSRPSLLFCFVFLERVSHTLAVFSTTTNPAFPSLFLFSLETGVLISRRHTYIYQHIQPHTSTPRVAGSFLFSTHRIFSCLALGPRLEWR